MRVSHPLYFAVFHQKISAVIIPFSLYSIIYVQFGFEWVYLFLNDIKYDTIHYYVLQAEALS